MKKIVSTTILAGLLTLAASGQTQAGAQASGSANTSTSVQAGDKSASANTSAHANAATNASKNQGSAKGSASNAAHGSASASGNQGSLNLAGDSAIQAVLSKPVATGKNKSGDHVFAKTTSDLKQDGKVIVPKGSKLIGHVTQAKARGKGEAQSSLGLMFDSIETKDGRHIPIQGTLQAIAAPAASVMADDDDMMAGGSGSIMNSTAGGGMISSPARSGGGGGLLGGSGGAVGGLVNTATSATGSVAAPVAGTVHSATGVAGNATGNLGGNAANATGLLNAGSTGALNMRHVQLMSAGQGAANGSVLTSTEKNIHLESGSQMLVNLAAERGKQQ